MSSETEPITIENAHYYMIQRRWTTQEGTSWNDSSCAYWGEDGLPGAMATRLSMVKTHGLDNIKMIRRDTFTTEVEITTDVHTEHCCDMHGCQYGDNETCTVATGLRPQSYPCERCHEEIYEDGGWETAHLLNEMYMKGHKKGAACWRCGSEVTGLCYDCT